MPKLWKRGRGKLGFMQPLLGDWLAEATTPVGPARCSRSLAKTLGDSYIQLDARWEFNSLPKKSGTEPEASGPKVYRELALYGVNSDGKVVFWSFTSDGKNSQGTTTEAPDVHDEAIAFEAQMPAGLARMVYWPDGEGGFFWAVESKTAKGWRRFSEHHYHRA
jgi:hypothetical protein